MEIMRIGNDSFDIDKLLRLGSGQFGTVYELRTGQAAKRYYDDVVDQQRLKLLRMCASAPKLLQDPQLSNSIAIPVMLAMDSHNTTIGYSMASMASSANGETRVWPKLIAFSYDPNSRRYRSHNGTSLDENTAVKLVFDLFIKLSALAKQHVVLGDISGGNVLYNPIDQTIGLIDIDSAHFEDWESESCGTEGYIDPQLLDQDRNSVGGLNFDSRSDVFSMTVLAFHLLVGTMPYFFSSDPPMKSHEERASQGLSLLRLVLEGDQCLRSAGVRLIHRDEVDYVRQRMQELRDIKGQSGQDGEIVYSHFVGIFVNDERENLVERLPENDSRDPVSLLLRRLRVPEIIADTKRKLGIPIQKSASGLPQLPAVLPAGYVGTKTGRYYDKDPSPFGPFLELRGIDYAGMIAG